MLEWWATDNCYVEIVDNEQTRAKAKNLRHKIIEYNAFPHTLHINMRAS